MQVVYALEEIPETVGRSIFLMGPTPRDEGVVSWRADALKILEDIGFEDGVVYVPEPRDGKWHKEYDQQVEWEELCLNQCDCIVSWVPRNLETMPAYTTNIEWGRWENSGKMILGYPEGAEKMRYMQHYADKLNIPSFDNLTETLQAAIEFIGTGKQRSGGSRMIPLYIYNSPQFQSWYQTQTSAGNRLDDAKVLYNFRPNNGKFVFLWVLWVDMYITSEDRHKTNEVVLSRTDISSVVMWRHAEPILNSEIVLVREYRSPASTLSGFILELPGGSSANGDDAPEAVAAEEIHEEVGLHLSPDRLKFEGAKQLAGTFSAHKSHLYSVQLTDEELAWLKSQKDVLHGNVEDSEQTYIEVYKLEEIFLGKVELDWTNLGMIAKVIYNED